MSTPCTFVHWLTNAAAFEAATVRSSVPCQIDTVGRGPVMAMTDGPEEMARVKAFIDRLNLRAIEMDGTCTGEHGIGEGKQEFLVREHGANVDTMRAIKAALDPHNIMNPGKIFRSG